MARLCNDHIFSKRSFSKMCLNKIVKESNFSTILPSLKALTHVEMNSLKQNVIKG